MSFNIMALIRTQKSVDPRPTLHMIYTMESVMNWIRKA